MFLWLEGNSECNWLRASKSSLLNLIYCLTDWKSQQWANAREQFQLKFYHNNAIFLLSVSRLNSTRLDVERVCKSCKNNAFKVCAAAAKMQQRITRLDNVLFATIFQSPPLVLGIILQWGVKLIIFSQRQNRNLLAVFNEILEINFKFNWLIE